jgi:hypothetical protein
MNKGNYTHSIPRADADNVRYHPTSRSRLKLTPSVSFRAHEFIFLALLTILSRPKMIFLQTATSSWLGSSPDTAASQK